jgi:hypothetical protein
LAWMIVSVYAISTNAIGKLVKYVDDFCFEARGHPIQICVHQMEVPVRFRFNRLPRVN